ncbi:hypothetical protein EHM69_04175 [candidate division KSB1 bacterium]|nr:MAG: hypothetical protein EHM69_04175 [candidate division KSB1 bacterium]
MTQPPDGISGEQLRLMERLTERLAHEDLTSPARLFFETSRWGVREDSPTHTFLTPHVDVVAKGKSRDLLWQSLQQRAVVEYALHLIDEHEQKRLRMDEKEARRMQNAISRKRKP